MRLWLVPSPEPGAAQTALARPDSGPEPFLPQWLVPLMRARSRVDRMMIGSSRHRARSRISDRPLLRWALGLRMSGPYFALGRGLATLG